MGDDRKIAKMRVSRESRQDRQPETSCVGLAGLRSDACRQAVQIGSKTSAATLGHIALGENVGRALLLTGLE